MSDKQAEKGDEINLHTEDTLDRDGTSEDSTVLGTPEEALELFMTKVQNGRLSGGKYDPVKFRFALDGRFDSFTEYCDSLANAEWMYRFPFRIETDHLFLYTKQSRAEASRYDGFALCLQYGLFTWFGSRFRDGFGLVRTDIGMVEPKQLFNHLNSSNEKLMDETVGEQMVWVQEALRHGLLASDYPVFEVGYITDGPWIALPLGASPPRGFTLFSSQSDLTRRIIGH